MTEAPQSVSKPGGGGFRASNVALSFLVGFLFSLIQFNYFFFLEVHLTSRAISFFVALFFWLVGFLVGLNLPSRNLFPRLLLCGVLAYYPALLLARAFPFNKYILPLVGLCITVSGMMPGNFFPYARERFSRVRTLFFHENNGFLLGILVALLCAVFAGKWLLTFAPLVGLAPVLGILWYQKLSSRASEKPPPLTVSLPRADVDSVPVGNVFPFFITGIHFGILQAALFFLVQVYVTATFVGYFVVVLAWMLGVILNLKLAVPKSLEKALSLSAAGYYVVVLLASIFTPYRVLIPLYFLLVVVVALPAGAFFREFSRSVSSRSLFLHENNGFILGCLLGMFGFVKWGVNFLYLAPLVSLSMALLVRSVWSVCMLIFLPVAAFLCIQLDNLHAFGTILLANAIGLWTCFIRPRPTSGPLRSPADEKDPDVPTKGSCFFSTKASRALLGIAGCNLILLQYFITREFSSILAASEVTILIVGTAYFTGYSLGYGVSPWFSPSLLREGAFVMFFIHLAVLLFTKVCAGYLIHGGFGMAVLVGLLFLTSFCTSSLYSILLPRIIDAKNDVSLVTGYTWDLSGAIAGIGVMFFLTAWAPSFLWPLYFLLMLFMLLILFWESPWRPGVLLVGLVVIGVLTLYQDRIRTYATEDYYRTRNYDYPRVVFQGNSFYHSVEILDSFKDPERSRPLARTSFINGIPYFQYRYDENGTLSGETSLSEFTYFLAELPAKYLYGKTGRKLRILIMGGGSMYSIYRVSPYSAKTTLVEIDPLIVESSKACWAGLNRHDRITNYEIVFNDVKHYLRTTSEKFDLIINDISAPYYLGTALLHGREFFVLVKSRLKPGGLFAESTQGRPHPQRFDSQGMKILRGVADVFPHYRVVDCRTSPRGRHGFVYASEKFKFSTQELADLVKKDGMHKGTSTYWEGTPHFRLHKVVPFSLTNMETLLSGNVWRLKGRLHFAAGRKARALSFGSLLRRVFNRDDPLHSRLIQAILQNLGNPVVLGVCFLGILVALGLCWKKMSPVG